MCKRRKIIKRKLNKKIKKGYLIGEYEVYQNIFKIFRISNNLIFYKKKTYYITLA